MSGGWVVALLAIAVTGASAARAQSATTTAHLATAGTPFLRVYGTDDHGGSPVNLHVAIDRRGVVYVANSLRVLEFDGARWRQIPQPSLTHAGALVLDDAGHLWSSVRSALSKLVPDATGSLHFKSRQQRLPTEDATIGELRGGVAGTDGLFVFTAKRIFLLRRDGGTVVWRATTEFDSLFLLSGKPFGTQAGRGLFQLETIGALRPISTGGLIMPRVYAARTVPDHATRQLLLTQAGPLLWDGPGTEPQSLDHDAGEFFSRATARAALHAIFLDDGSLAFATASDGLVVFDAAGRLTLQLTKASGLHSDRVNELAEDETGGLWLAQQKGIARVQLDSPYRVHGDPREPMENVRSAIRHEGRFYVTDGEGLLEQNPATGRFQRLPGLPANTVGATTFLSLGARLLVNAGGVREVLPDGRLVSLAARSLYALHPASGRPGGFLGLQRDANGRGLWALEANGNALRVLGRIDDVAEPERFGFDDGAGCFWGTDTGNHVWRADFRDGLRARPQVTRFELPSDATAGEERLFIPVAFPFGDGVSAAHDKKLYRFDPAARRFVLETRIEGLPVNLDFNLPVRDAEGATWLRYGGFGHERVRLFRIVPNGPDRWRAVEFPSGVIDQLNINNLYPEPGTSTLWICSNSGLFSVDTAWHAREHPMPAVLVRRIETPAGRLVFDGDSLPSAPSPMLQPDERSLRVEFALPVHTMDYRGRIRTLYRTRLEGLDEAWSAWSEEATRTFTNLPAGDLIFHVQARDLDERESAVTSFAFTLPPPWWRGGWAIGGYCVAGAGALFGLERLRTQALRMKNERLETIVAGRTADLRRQNDELTRLHKLELDAKISERLRAEKAQLDVLRYQLNPHFLFNSLTSIRSQIPVAIDGARAAVDRLADFCRLTLHGRKPDENSTIGEEVAMLRAYLDIEQARMKELLSVEFAIAPNLETESIPRLLLLPLVENALKYGSATSAPPLRVRVAARRADDGALQFEVANTGHWVRHAAAHDLPSLGIGHDNLRERLRRHYPDAHCFTTEETGGWVVAKIVIARPERKI